MEKSLSSGETVVLRETLVDEWASVPLRKPVGTIERSIAVVKKYEGVNGSYPNSNLPKEIFLELMDYIDSREKAEIVLAFLDRLRSLTDPAQIEHEFESFKSLLPEFANNLQVVYLEHFHAYKKMKSIDQFPSTDEALQLLNFIRSTCLFDVIRIFKTQDISWDGAVCLPDFFQGADHHVFTQELIKGLAEEIRKVQTDASRPVVEIGAGRGKLAAGLRAEGLHVIAVDSYSKPNVEAMDSKEAVQHYQPEVIVASWLPRYLDIGKEAIKQDCVRHAFVLECQRDPEIDVERIYNQKWIEVLEPFSLPSNFHQRRAKKTVFRVSKI